MNKGKLYKSNDGQLVEGVRYQLISDEAEKWWGELVLAVNKPVNEQDCYVIEMEHGRKGMCFLKKRINRAVSGFPAMFHYHFMGQGKLK
ncbi:MAG: hypothetical protein V1767_01440 [Chloroflexota bacterium]